MDAFILPSRNGEGLPMVLLEAMAIGIPIFASDVEGVRGALGDSTSSRIFKPEDSKALANQIKNYVSNPQRFIAAADCTRKRQVKIFSDNAMAKNLAQLYSEITKK